MLVRQKEGSEVYEAVVLSKVSLKPFPGKWRTRRGRFRRKRERFGIKSSGCFPETEPVFTPCLKKSEGNLHFSLFDYRNEVVPNQALQNLFGELFEEGDE